MFDVKKQALWIKAWIKLMDQAVNMLEHVEHGTHNIKEVKQNIEQLQVILNTYKNKR